nr:dockerin type I repeat-containing protein [candidate division Zixibacteria bacterium]
MTRFAGTIFIVGLCLAAQSLGADDQVYPAGSNFNSDYSLSADIITSADTLTINRYLVNNENFELLGLYFSDNLPTEFVITEYAVTINGNPVEIVFEEMVDSVYSEYKTCYWVITDPDGTITNDINPGDSLDLELSLVCNTAGQYALPLHTTVLFGNDNGYFCVGDSLNVEVIYPPTCGDADGSGALNILDVTFLVNYLYKNGEAPSPIESGDEDGNGVINILDVTYLIKYLYKDGDPPVCP